MTPRRRNFTVWAGVVAVCAALWFIAARTRLHFIDPTRFLIVVAIAAAVLTALLWWELRHDDPTDPAPPIEPPAPPSAGDSR